MERSRVAAPCAASRILFVIVNEVRSPCASIRATDHAIAAGRSVACAP